MRRISRRVAHTGSRWLCLCVSWGMSLCRLHHAAFDRLILGVSELGLVGFGGGFLGFRVSYWGSRLMVLALYGLKG